MPDIKQLVRSSGIDAERTATQLFGMAVEDFAAKPLNAALKGLFPGQENQPINRNDGSWYATSYAHSLANSQYRPKLKFLFRVEFLFKPDILAKFGAQAADWQRNFKFMIKSVDRPKVDFEYEEVNKYNFRTKVLKQIKHRELTLTFMDDVGNHVYEFFRFMMMVHSPITRRSVNASSDLDKVGSLYSSNNENGMLFTDELGNRGDYAHRGVMDPTIGNAIEAIKVTQMFVRPGGPQDIDTAAKEVSFFFINPRVVSFDLDDVNHEANEPNLFTMQFDYDFMIMSDMENLKPLDPAKALPPLNGAPGDAAPTGRVFGQATNSGQGNNNPYTAILAGVAGRAVQKITSDTIGRQIRKIPGLGSVADTIGGIASGVTRQTIGGLGNSLNQSFARPGRDVVVDSSTAGRDSSSYTTSTGSFGLNQPTPNSGD